MTSLDGLQASNQDFPHRFGAIEQLFLFKDFEDGESGGAGDRTTGVSAAQATWRDAVHDFGPTSDAGQREAAGNRFGESSQVSCNAHLLHGEESPGTPCTGLNLIGN
ncbi:hypothetical protein D3C75_731710 [compost metagenome]